MLSEAGIFDRGIILELLKMAVPRLAGAREVFNSPCSTPCAESQAYMRSGWSLSTGCVFEGSGDTTKADGESWVPLVTSCIVGASVSNSLVNIDPDPSDPVLPTRPTKCSNLVGVATTIRRESDRPGSTSTHSPVTGPSEVLYTAFRYRSWLR